MNITILSGRLTQDPELRYTQSNTPVATFCLAVDRRDENKTTDFFNCVAWQKTGELVSKYVSKGDKVTIRGRLQNRSWNDKEGNKRTVTEIIVDEVEFQPKSESAKPTQMEKPAPAPQSAPAPQPTPQPAPKPEQAYYTFDDGDTPF